MNIPSEENVDKIIKDRTDKALKLIIYEAKQARKRIAQVAPTILQRKQKQKAWEDRCKMKNPDCCSNDKGAEDKQTCDEELVMKTEITDGKFGEKPKWFKVDEPENLDITDFEGTIKKVEIEEVHPNDNVVLEEVTTGEVLEYTKKEMDHLIRKAHSNLRRLEADLNESVNLPKKESSDDSANKNKSLEDNKMTS